VSTLDDVGSGPMPADVPRWLRDIESSLPVRAQFVLTGNVRDIHLLPPPPDSGGRTAPRRLPTVEALWEVLSRSGYECLIVHDPVDHLTVHPPTDAARQSAVDVVGPLDSGRDVGLARLAEIVRAVATTRAHRIALVLDYASRLTVNPQTLEDDEHRFLVACEKASHLALPLYVDGVRPGPLYNPLFWIVSSERDLPAWLLLRNEAIKTVSIPLPDLDERLRLAALLVPSLPDAREALAAQDRTPRASAVAPEESVIDRAVRRFAEQSEAMTLGSMVEISRLAIERRLPVTDIEDAVRAYRVGMLDNPWKRPLLRDRIRAGDAELARHVLGQQRAIHKVVDVLIRSATGLTAAHSAGHASRPRGILFFAGPTGVGKTEQIGKSVV